MAYTYYSTLRPVGPGTCPKDGLINFVNFDIRMEHTPIGRPAWGYLEYDHLLPAEVAKAYNLVYCSAPDLERWNDSLEVESIV